MNGLAKLTQNAKKAVKNSYNAAKRNNKNILELPYLLAGLLETEDGIASRVLKATGFNTLVEEKILTYSAGDAEETDGRYSAYIKVADDYRKALENAFSLAKSQYHVYVGTEHLLLGILKQKKHPFVSELSKAGLTYEYTEKYIASYANYPPGLLSKLPAQEDKGNSILPMLGRDLTELARKGEVDAILGREKEIDRLIHVLERRSKNNPILIGEAGVGKTAIVEGLAQRIVKGEVPEDMQGAQVWAIDTARLMASTEMRGDLEAKVMAFIEEVGSKKNVIIFIDEVHSIVGSTPGNDIANILKPFLSRSAFRCIGATTLAEYQKFFEPDAALTRRFQPIYVEEVSEDVALTILKNLKIELERYHKVKISDDAIAVTVKLSNRYITDRYLPDKAIDVLDEAAAKMKLERQDVTEDMKAANSELVLLEKEKEGYINENEFDKALEVRRKEKGLRAFLDDAFQSLKRSRTSTKYIVTEDIVRDVIAEWTGIPVATLTVADKSSLKDIDKELKKEIIGQDNAVDKVSHAIKSARLGIRNENKPMASFIFLGPTGVGKTELAKQVAKYLFGDTRPLIHVDMSEYMESHSVSKFIGSPPGYIGFQEGGQLTEKVRRRPYSVILFDEIEKAHIDVLNILLQVLEEGHLTDSKGRKVNFRNTIIILTSNIGAEKIKADKVLGFNLAGGQNVSLPMVNKDAYGDSYENMRSIIMQELKAYLTPEFMNRLDDIVIFRGLSKEDIEVIAGKLLGELQERLKQNKITLTIEKGVAAYIAEKGYDKEYGARPIRRAIEEYLEFPLSDMVLSKESKKAVYKIKAFIEGEGLEKHINVSFVPARIPVSIKKSD